MDKNAFAQRVLEAESTLYHISKSILKNDFDCADAVQEAILKAFGSLHTLKNEQHFKTWLCRILINECYKMSRSFKRWISYEDYMEAEQPAAPTVDYGLYGSIMRLKEKHRLAIVLHYIEGFKTAEIADMLGIPEGTVKSRLSKARSELRITLDNEEEYGNEAQ